MPRAMRDTVLTCGLLERFNPAVRTAVEIARQPLHITTVRHSPYAERIRTGVASDLLIHDIDLVVRLMGEAPATLTGHYGYFEPRSTTKSEDVAEATLRFSDGQIASLSVSRIAQHKIRSLTIAELGRADRRRPASPVDHHLPPRAGIGLRRGRRVQPADHHRDPDRSVPG